MNHGAVVMLVAAIPLTCFLLGCAEVPHAGSKESPDRATDAGANEVTVWSRDRASITGTINDQKGNRFTEHVTAILTQGTSSRSVLVEKGEFRFDNLLTSVECSLAFTSIQGGSIGKKDQIKLETGENRIDYVVEKMSGGKFKFVPNPKRPVQTSPGPVK